MKKIKWIFFTAAFISSFFCCNMFCMASGLTVEGTVVTESEYTTIRVNAQDDGNGELLYAIDSDAPEAFGTSDTFTVKKGSEHTIYVKDTAGNISAQVYKVPDAEMDMEVNLGYSNTSSAAEVTDEQRDAIEKGGGTVSEQVGTGNVDAERLFFTVSTKDEHVFYLVVDQSRSENNVYLLDQVTDEDLYSLASEGKESESKTSVFSTIGKTTTSEQEEKQEEIKEEKKSGGDLFFWIVLIVCGAAAIYYYKIYKPKQAGMKDLSDAKDLDEFEFEDENAEDELDFTVTEEEKQEMMQKIISCSDLDDTEFTEEELNYKPEEDVYEAEEESETEDNDVELELPEEEEE